MRDFLERASTYVQFQSQQALTRIERRARGRGISRGVIQSDEGLLILKRLEQLLHARGGDAVFYTKACEAHERARGDVLDRFKLSSERLPGRTRSSSMSSAFWSSNGMPSPRVN